MSIRCEQRPPQSLGPWPDGTACYRRPHGSDVAHVAPGLRDCDQASDELGSELLWFDCDPWADDDPVVVDVPVQFTPHQLWAGALHPAWPVKASRRWDTAAAAGRELAAVAAMFVAWQVLVHWTQTRTAGARSVGLAIWHAEQALHIAIEPAVQRAALALPGVVPGADVFYDAAQWGSLVGVLGWLWWRHRDGYTLARAGIVGTTLVAWLVQLVPTAPLRLLHAGGIVDTAAAAGTSVYTDQHVVTVGQYAAFPSIHVAWAVVLGVALWRRAGRARWLGPALIVATVLDVLVTGNHSVIDCTAGALLAVVVARVARRFGRPVPTC
jgi:hypothetical protein